MICALVVQYVKNPIKQIWNEAGPGCFMIGFFKENHYHYHVNSFRTNSQSFWLSLLPWTYSQANFSL